MKDSLVFSRFKNLAEISRDVAQVFFASVVISPLVNQVSRENIFLALMGIIGSLIFWVLSSRFAEKGKL